MQLLTYHQVFVLPGRIFSLLKVATATVPFSKNLIFPTQSNHYLPLLQGPQPYLLNPSQILPPLMILLIFFYHPVFFLSNAFSFFFYLIYIYSTTYYSPMLTSHPSLDCASTLPQHSQFSVHILPALFVRPLNYLFSSLHSISVATLRPSSPRNVTNLSTHTMNTLSVF